MPGAPASTQTFTASSTEGTVPPREFLIVATLLTFTESLTKLYGSGEVLADRLGNLLCPRRNLALILPFDHDAKQRFGSRISDQKPTVPGESRFNGRYHARHLRNCLQVHPAIDADVHQNLWVRGEL